MTDPRIRRAVHNNAEWCAAVCGAHGDSGQMTESAWIHASSPPSFYPNIVVLDARPNRSLMQIERLLASRAGSAWSVKDSFAALDLAPLGGSLLFTAEWLWRDPNPHSHAVRAATRIRDEATLARWEAARRRASGLPDNSPRTFLPALLANEDVVFIALGEAHEPILRGVIAYRAAGVVGMSNLFCPSQLSVSEADTANELLEATRATTKFFPGLPVVTYGTGAYAEGAAQAGFASVGELRVWVNT